MRRRWRRLARASLARTASAFTTATACDSFVNFDGPLVVANGAEAREAAMAAAVAEPRLLAG